jgi:hypothetical protein
VSRTHGKSHTPAHRTWKSMLQRCNNPKRVDYHRYGGRGIKVCKRWAQFENFFADMGERPEGTTLDRVNTNGDYKKSNCRWISHKENCQTRTNARNIIYLGRELSMTQWATQLGISVQTISSRVRAGRPVKEILSRGKLNRCHL